MATHLDDEARRRIWRALADGRDANTVAAEVGHNWRTVRDERRRMLRAGANALLAEPECEDAKAQKALADERQAVQARDEIARLKTALRDAHRQAIDDDAILAVLGMVARAAEQPPQWLARVPAGGAKPSQEVPVTIWSDWHVGEVVSRAEVGGFNEYSIAIAEARVRRLLDNTINVCRDHGPGNYPGIVVNLLGDFVSGGLHPELAKSDEEEVIPSVLRCRDLLIACIARMADAFGRVYVPCAAGNHGRYGPKPEFKRYVYKNFDWLIYQLLVRHFADDDRVTIHVPPTNEVRYNVFGHRYLAMHGDMLGVKGGDGIIGSIGPIVRGEVKARGQSSTISGDYDMLLIGHWHQEFWLPRAIVANSLKGFDEYAKNALRAPPSEPSQPLWFVHPSRGITSRWSIKVENERAPATEWVTWQGAAA